MKLAKALAALVSAAALMMFAGHAAGAGGEAGLQPSTPPAPAVSQQAEGPEQPGQSLGALTGEKNSAAQARGNPGQWLFTADTSAYGTTCIEPGQTFLLGGHTLTIYGDLTVSGTLDLDGGKLILRKDPDTAHHPQANGNLIIDGGLLVMQHAADFVQVGKSFIADGGDETGKLTAGTLCVGGDFLQLQDNSQCSYAASGTHMTEFTSSGALAQFYSPAFSSIRNLRLDSGAAFTSLDRQIDVERSYIAANGQLVWQSWSYPTTGGTFLSLSQALSGEYSITVPNLYYWGNQNGKKLTVNGSLLVPLGSKQAFSGDIAATSLYVAGTLNVSAGTISAKNFFASGACVMTGGELDISGSFRQIETAGVSASKQAFQASGSSSVVFTGAGCSCVFDSPGSSYFSAVSLAPGASFAPDAAVSVKRDLQADASVTSPLVYFTGNLKGHKLTVTGSLDIPAGFSLTPGGGTLDVSGGVTVDGELNMQAGGDHVKAGGDFLARGDASVYENGLLEVGGMFRQCGAGNQGSADSFAGGSGLLVRLTATQADWGAKFDDPDSSRFGALEIAAHPSHAISADSVISLRGDLSADLDVPSPARLYYSGSLNGHRLRAQDVVIPAAQTLSVGTGRLDASGSLDVLGILDMQDAKSTVTVSGAFTAEGPDSWGHLVQGYLAVGGAFTQKKDVSVRSFCPEESFKTLLTGGDGQAVSYGSPMDPGSLFDSTAQGSWFGALYTYGAPAYATGHYACSECATGTGLSGLTASSGSGELALAPAFGSSGTAYEAMLPEGDASLSLAAARNFSNQIVQTSVSGTPLPGDSGTGSNTVPIDVTGTPVLSLEAESAAGEPYPGAGEPFAKTYTLTIHPVNTKLASVSFTNAAFSAGVVFNPADSAAVYGITVPVACENFTLSPALADPNASYRFICGGQESTGTGFTRNISPGETVEVDVKVTAYGSANDRTYRFLVCRQALITGIALSSGTLSPLFDAATDSYTVEVPASAYLVKVTPQKGDGCASVEINGQLRDSIDLAPDIGASAQAGITLGDSGGTFVKTYTVTVSRAPLLSGISVSADSAPVSLNPAFSSAVHAYRADVPVNASVTVSAAGTSDCSSVLINGSDSIPCGLAVAPGGSANAVVAALAGSQPEQQASYTVTVRKPLLIGLNLSAGSLDAPFDPDPATTTHVTLPYATSSVTLEPVANDSGAGLISLTYADEAGSCSSTIILAQQGDTKNITVQAGYGSGSPVGYTVVLHRELSDNADLASFGASDGWLSPAFSADATDYTLLLPETASSVVLSPIAADSRSTYKIGSQPANTPCTLTLPQSGQLSADIVVTALRGNAKTYHITVRRTQAVSAFTASPVASGYASLSPGGTDRLTFSFTLAVPSTVKIEVKKGSKWYALLNRAEASPGTDTFIWDGKVSGKTLSSGSYSVRATPYASGKAGTVKTMTVKILAQPGVSVTKLSPSTLKANGTNKLTLTFKWTHLCDVRVDVVTSKYAFVTTLYTAANQSARSQTLTWDGRNASGSLVPAGTYKIKITCGGKTVYKTIKIKR